MVYCPNCGTPNEDISKFCRECGAEIRFDGQSKPQRDYPPDSGYQDYTGNYSQPGYNPSYQPSYTPARIYQPDEAEGIYYCCSFCFPIVGVVLWLIWKDERPQTAQTMLVISIISFVISFFFGLVTA